MLSGGLEGVLVMWQYKTHHQEFLPRLGAPINHLTVSPDDSLTAVSQNENGITSFLCSDFKCACICMYQLLKFFKNDLKLFNVFFAIIV